MKNKAREGQKTKEVFPENLAVVAKQQIQMPGRHGIKIPKGTPFIWHPKSRHYVAHIGGHIVAAVTLDYVNKVNIFEPTL